MSKICTPTSTLSSYTLRKPRKAPIAFLAKTGASLGFQRSCQRGNSAPSAEHSRQSEKAAPTHEQIETCFIQALVSAGNCIKNEPKAHFRPHILRSSASLSHRPRRTGVATQQRLHSTHALRGWGRGHVHSSANGGERQPSATSASLSSSVSQSPVDETNKVATWGEYYEMMDKCFLRPPIQDEACLESTKDVPGYSDAAVSYKADASATRRGSHRKATSERKYYAMLDKSFPRPAVKRAPLTESRVDPRASATGMKQKLPVREGKQRTSEEMLHYRAAVRRQATRLASPRHFQRLGVEGFYTPTYHDPVWQSVENFVELAARNYARVRRGEVFEAYQKIPRPRLRYIPEKSRRRLLSHLSIQRMVSDTERMEYMTVMDDHKEAGIPLGRREWSTAISLTARAASKTSSTNVNAALQLWREMENDAKIPANTTTFNILLDMAAKAGKFHLADTIWKEMEHRQVTMDLFSYTTKIFLEGLRGSASGVRSTYDALVKAGEVVDTSVISAVITAYLKCNDPGAAESVFSRAKRMHAEEHGGPRPLQPNDWLERRKQGRMFKNMKQKDVEQTTLSPVAPGQHVYRELVHYHAVTAGNIDRALALVDEMVSLYRIPLEGRIFLNLFKAFAKHGGSPYSSWTPQYLDAVFELMLKQIDGPPQQEQPSQERPDDKASSHNPSEERVHPKSIFDGHRLFVGEALVELCVSAFLKCHSLERAEQVSFLVTSRMFIPSPELNERLERRFDAREAEEDRRIDWQNDQRIAAQEQELD